MTTNSEADAVRARYERRRGVVATDRYSLLAAANWQSLQERQRTILRLLARHGVTDLASQSLVEVGAGTGGNLLELLRLGFDPASLTGIELLADRVELARRVLPSGLNFIAGDATQAPIPPQSQDLVFQAVVFSSLLDDAFQQQMADCMWSWLKPGGAVLWYDFTYNNPSNPDVRGVPLARVRQLFPRARIEAHRVTLAPPIARRVSRIHPSLYSLFNALPLLRTHLLCWIEKP